MKGKHLWSGTAWKHKFREVSATDNYFPEAPSLSISGSMQTDRRKRLGATQDRLRSQTPTESREKSELSSLAKSLPFVWSEDPQASNFNTKQTRNRSSSSGLAKVNKHSLKEKAPQSGLQEPTKCEFITEITKHRKNNISNSTKDQPEPELNKYKYKFQNKNWVCLTGINNSERN